MPEGSSFNQKEVPWGFFDSELHDGWGSFLVPGRGRG